MKFNLYQIFKDIIKEEKNALLNESVSRNEVMKAIDERFRIRIYYQGDTENKPGTRLIDVYAYGLTKSGNPCIRAFQPFGMTTTEIPAWKIFRLDRITRWERTNFKLTKVPISDLDSSIPKYNEFGDRSMSVVYKNYIPKK